MDYQTFQGGALRATLFRPERRAAGRPSVPAPRRSAGPPSRAKREKASDVELHEIEVGRELSQLRFILGWSRGGPPLRRPRALPGAAGFEASRARGTGGTRAARSGPRERGRYLRQRVGKGLACKTVLIETRRCLIACVGATSVGETSTLAKLAACAVVSFKRTVRVGSPIRDAAADKVLDAIFPEQA